MLDRNHKQLKTEKDQYRTDAMELKDRLREKNKQLKESSNQQRLVMDEFNTVNNQ